MGDPESLQDMLTKSPLLLTPEDAAKVLRIGRTTVYALMKAGDLRPVHTGPHRSQLSAGPRRTRALCPHAGEPSGACPAPSTQPAEVGESERAL